MDQDKKTSDEEKVHEERRKHVLSDTDIERLTSFFKSVRCNAHDKLTSELEAIRISFAVIEGSIKPLKIITIAVGGVICGLLSALWWSTNNQLSSLQSNSISIHNSIDKLKEDNVKNKADLVILKERIAFIHPKMKEGESN
jgi:hypothetical protein